MKRKARHQRMQWREQGLQEAAFSLSRQAANSAHRAPLEP